MRTRAGYFFVNIVKILFEKPPLSIPQQITLLQERCLIFNDFPRAARQLETIGYYRLKAYFNPFLSQLPSETKNNFRTGTAFEEIIYLYDFDRELRLLVSDVLERIEIAFRAIISNYMSLLYGSHWYADATVFANKAAHTAFLNEVNTHLSRSHESFIAEYYETYHKPDHPPSWMIMECLSFGMISKLYGNIRDRKARMAIADNFGQFNEVIKSWMRSLTYTRNLCAHHARLWNRFFINKPQHVQCNNGRTLNSSPFYLQASILIHLISKIDPYYEWKFKLMSLFREYPLIPFEAMGFNSNWESDEIWSL